MEMSKKSPFVRAVGILDELQARIALARILLEGKENKNLEEIEGDLYQIMGSIYKGVAWKESEERIEFLKKEIEFCSEGQTSIEKFLVPGKNELGSRLNFCRTGCRLAEEELVFLKEEHEKEDKFFDGNILKYMNKLSTYFYWLWRETEK